MNARYTAKYYCKPCRESFTCENKEPRQAQPCPKCNKLVPSEHKEVGIIHIRTAN